jgi:hypothetical protein
MTICIAACCEGGNHIVTAADRMFTVGPPLNVEFEPPLTKIETMATACVGMGAGNGLFVSEILRRARAAYQNTPGTPVDHIAATVKDVYTSYRDEKIEETIIRPTLGPDFVSFRNRGGTLPAYLQPQPGIFQQLVVQSNQFNLGVDIIVAGIDAAGSHLYYVGNPGSFFVFDKIGYNAIGSGATHVAIKFALDLQHAKTSLHDTLLSVYSAKKSAEVAPGVGQETEIKVISSNEIWPVPNELLEVLDKAHKEGAKKARPNTDEIKDRYAKLRKNP